MRTFVLPRTRLGRTLAALYVLSAAVMSALAVWSMHTEETIGANLAGVGPLLWTLPWSVVVPEVVDPYGGAPDWALDLSFGIHVLVAALLDVVTACVLGHGLGSLVRRARGRGGRSGA